MGCNGQIFRIAAWETEAFGIQNNSVTNLAPWALPPRPLNCFLEGQDAGTGGRPGGLVRTDSWRVKTDGPFGGGGVGFSFGVCVWEFSCGECLFGGIPQTGFPFGFPPRPPKNGYPQTKWELLKMANLFWEGFKGKPKLEGSQF